MNTRVIITLFVLSLCLGADLPTCHSGFQSIFFERAEGDAVCKFLLSNLEQEEGLQLIADIVEEPSYCVNPGYYLIKCDKPTTVKITMYNANGQVINSEDAKFEVSETESKLAYHVEVENKELKNVTKDFDRSKPISGEEAYPKTPYDWREPIQCNQAGYLKYLNFWGDAKCTSKDPTTAEFQMRYEYFLDSCVKINDWNSRNKYNMEFTFYADWHPDEFEEITTNKQRYSGIHTPVPSTVPTYNNSNFRYLMPSVDPCDDDMGTIGINSQNMETTENGRRLYDLPIYTGDLASYICKPQNCSVSWAFAVTNSIEYAIKDLYIKEFDQIVRVSLSAQELIDCVGEEHGLEEGETCEGLPIAWGFDYAFNNGIAYRYFYPHTNYEGECKKLDDDQKYWIDGYEKPQVYNKLGLFELVQKGPTAVTLGLDPEFFQYYRSDRRDGPYFDTAFWRPSVYGVVVEYYQYEPEGSETFAEWPFFAIETRLRACYSMVFRLPIRESTDDANIAGIAGFAIRPIVSSMITKLVPTPEPPTLPPTLPPTTEPPTPTPEQWYAIYDPFILGDNSYYGSEELQQQNKIPSDMDVLQMYLDVRDAYPKQALYNTRVLALQGMTNQAITLFKESLAKQERLNPNPIDCYFYGDHHKPRYLEIENVVPLLELTQYTRPGRLVLSSGTIMREGMHAALKWMFENKEKGYFVNLEYLEISRNKCSNYQNTTDAVLVAKQIVDYIKDMCDDEVNYPKLSEMKFNNNAYNEVKDGFDTMLIEACQQSARPTTKITAPENDRAKKTLMCGGKVEFPTYDTYDYYDIDGEQTINPSGWNEKLQCRYTWNWEIYEEDPQYGPGLWDTN